LRERTTPERACKNTTTSYKDVEDNKLVSSRLNKKVQKYTEKETKNTKKIKADFVNQVSDTEGKKEPYFWPAILHQEFMR
jgi:hypothetical protein